MVLEEVRSGDNPDGLTLGVTATSPDALPADELFDTLEHIPETWLMRKKSKLMCLSWFSLILFFDGMNVEVVSKRMLFGW